jgi:hypothetical protein
MSLSCSCDSDGDWEWYFYEPSDYKPLGMKRSRKCCSCKSRVAVGDLCIEFPRYKQPGYDTVEERIHGDEMPISSYWMCEGCADQYFNLAALGFCITLPSDMRELLKEYIEMRRMA